MCDELRNMLNTAMVLGPLRNENYEEPYMEELILFLLQNNDGVLTATVRAGLEKQRRRIGKSIPDDYWQKIRNFFYAHCFSSNHFNNKNFSNLDAPFYWYRNKGYYFWAVDHIRAKKWVEKREHELKFLAD